MVLNRVKLKLVIDTSFNMYEKYMLPLVCGSRGIRILVFISNLSQ
jgi:hypothetical protein